MNYFSDLDIIKYGDAPRSRDMNSIVFDGYYGIQYTHRGEVELSFNRESPQRMTGPCAFISAPGTHFRYGAPAGTERHHVFLCFKGPRVDRWIEGGLLPSPGKLFPVRHGEDFLSGMLKIMDLLRQPGSWGKNRAVPELEALLLQGLESSESTALRPYRKALSNLADRILEQPVLDWDFSKEARLLDFSYSHFRKVFREMFGCPPGQYLLECRLNLAAKMLLETEKQIREIAFECGFQNEFYFSRIFRKHRFISPKNFRK